MSELLVHIQNEDKPITVSKLQNGLVVGKREVLVDDYIRSLMESLDEPELMGFLMEKEFMGTIENFIAEEVDHERYAEIFKIFIENCKSLTGTEPQKHDSFTKLFTVMLEKVNVTEVRDNLLADLLGKILLNVKKADYKDVEVYNQLFRLLLEKVDINKGSSIVIRDFLKLLLERLNEPSNKEDLREVFELITSKSAEESWLEEVIRERRPKTASYKTPILPSGTVFYKESITGVETIIIEIPKHQRDAQYQELHYKQVGHPNLLFVYQLSGKQIQSMMIFAKDSKPLSEDSQLYHYPYSHVYDSGFVCWGYRTEVIESLSQLKTLNQVFLETPNNHDLAREGSVEKYIKLQQKEFPDSALEPTNLTFKKLVASI